MLTDLLQSLRSLRRSPFLCAMALLTLGLGLGVNTAMFSILDTTLLRGMPMREESRVLRLFLHAGEDGLSHAEFAALRERQQSFENLAAYEDGSFTLRSPGAEPERVAGAVLNAAALSMIEAPLAFGRWFRPAEDLPGAAPVVVIGHTLWQQRFGSDPAILGKQLQINDEWATVIGVAAPGFRFPYAQDLWLPPRDKHLGDAPDDLALSVFGRLKPGVTFAQALAELTALAPRLVPERADGKVAWQVRLRTLSESYSSDSGLLWAMLGAVFLVLLIACGNVANLLLARAIVRSRELAVRSALGAGRTQLVRLLLGEAAVLTIGGTILGLGLAWGAVAVFKHAVVNANPPYWMTFGLDLRAIVYTVGLTGFTCLAAGLLPAWRFSRPDLNATLSDGSRGATSGRVGRLTRAMVVGEIALSCALLVVSALMIRSVVKMYTVPLGFEPRGAASGRIGLPEREYPTMAARQAFVQGLLADLRARPELTAAGASLSQLNWTPSQTVQLPGTPPPPPGQKPPTAAVRDVTPGFLAAMGIRLLEGRDLADSDHATAPPVALATRAFAERHWPGRSALGQTVQLGTGARARTVTIVGIFNDTVQGQFEREAPPQVYVPLLQAPELQRVTFVVRGRDGVEDRALAPLLRAALSRRDAQLPLYFAAPLSEMVLQSMFQRKLFAGIFGVFGAAAFLLAVIGLYGVMSYGVAQRRQEMGVRLALGATARDLVRLVVGQGAWQLAIGLAAGLALAALGAQVLSSVLYGVDVHDPVSFLAATLALGAAGLLASFIPGLRAGRVDPATVLRGG